MFNHMNALAPNDFVPYIAFPASYVDDSGFLKVTFSLVNKLPPLTDDCGAKVIRVCENTDLDPITSASLRWRICSGVYIVLDTDTNPNIKVVLIKDSDDLVIAIRIEVHHDYVVAANDFSIYGVINGTPVKLTRGRIYVSTEKVQTANVAPPVDDDSAFLVYE